MSGRDLVDDMRSGARPLPKRPRGVIDILIVTVAAVALVSLGVVGFNTWFHRPPPQRQVVQIAAANSPKVTPAVWSEDDDEGCAKRARAAVASADSGSYLVTNRSITEGVAGLVTLTQCKLTTKVTRFCGSEGKSQLVGIVNDYLGRMDLVALGIGAQGAPMKIVGGMFGGEPEAGSAIYDDMAKQTFAYMSDWNVKVVNSVRGLARKGVVKAEDFATFTGGVPENIQKLLGDVEASSDICA